MRTTKYIPRAYDIVAVWVICGLGIYGIKAWYFIERWTWALVASLFLIGLVLGVQISRRITHRGVTKGRLVAVALLISGFFTLGVGVGAPAVAMRLMGPDSKISATVLRKEHGGRKCRRKIYIAEYWPSRLCVSDHDYERLERGGSVQLVVRSNILGTFVFSVEPSQ